METKKFFIAMLSIVSVVACSPNRQDAAPPSFEEYKIFFETNRDLFNSAISICKTEEMLKKYSLIEQEATSYSRHQTKLNKLNSASALSGILEQLGAIELECGKVFEDGVMELHSVRLSLFARGIVVSGQYVGVFYWPDRHDNMSSFTEEELLKHNSKLSRLDDKNWYFMRYL